MVVDAFLTALVGFSSQGWHMMLAAGILPLASGTAPAAKGCMMEMVSPSKKGDALSAIALVEVRRTDPPVQMPRSCSAQL